MATSYLAPGVYVEEVAGGSKPIEGVGTAVAGFIGFAEKGPFNQATLITNWTQFRATFGDFIEGAYLAHSVYGYFNNGGGVCYVVRLGSEGSGAAGGQISTDGWFDSNLPPAAAQPEAGNLRASDNDPDSRAAHQGMPDSVGTGLDPSTPPAVPSLPTIPPLPKPDELSPDDLS